MLLRLYINIVLVTLCCSGLYAQLDTTLNRILNLESDSLILDQLVMEGNKLLRIDLEKAWIYANHHDSITSATQNGLWKAESLTIKGNIHFTANEYDAAIERLTAAAQLFEQHDPLYHELASISNTIAAIYTQREGYDKAIDYYNNSLRIIEASKDTAFLAITSLNSSVPHIQLKNHKLAEEALLKADSLLQIVGPAIYRGYSLLNLADNYQEQGLHDLARQHALKAMTFMPLTSDPKIHSGANLILAKAEQADNYFQKAIDHYRMALEISESVQYTNHMVEANSGLWTCYELVGQYEKGFVYLKQYESLKDTLNKASEDQRMLDVLKKFEFEKKEAEVDQLKLVDELNQEKIAQQKMALAGTGLGLAILSFLLYRIFTQKNKIQEKNEVINQALKDKDFLLKEIHHRVKNNLQVISSLLGIQSRGIADAKAKEAINESRSRVHSMSLIHQNLYKKENLTGVQINEYLSKLAQNLLTTYNISQGNIIVETDVEALSLDVDTVVPIGLIVNELITNSLKYAFPNHTDGKITIKLKELSGQLFLSVADNGIGLDSDQLHIKKESFGHSLIKAFKNKLGADITIDGQDGTKVELLIKNYRLIA